MLFEVGTVGADRLQAAQADQVRTALEHGRDLGHQIAHGQRGRTDQGRDLVHQSELARGGLVDHEIDTGHVERSGAAEPSLYGRRAGQQIARLSGQGEPGRRARLRDEVAVRQPGPQPLVGGGAQRHPRPELTWIHADHARRLAAHADLRAVEGDHLPDALDRPELGQLGRGQPLRQHDQQVRNDNAAKR